MPTQRPSNKPTKPVLPHDNNTDSSSWTDLPAAIRGAQQKLRTLRSLANPPFWDQLDGWSDADFQRQLKRMIRLRSLKHMDACEHFEDLLAAMHTRRSEILRVTIYQILLALPPIPRRGTSSVLRKIDPRVIRKVLAEIPIELQEEALKEPNWPRSARELILEMSPCLQSSRRRAKGSRAHTARSDGPFGPKTTELLERVIQGLTKVESLLPVPPSWVGATCLDLRFENLSTLAEDHLARWPDADILATALVGLSPGNKAKALARFPENGIRERLDQIEKGFTSWRSILQAQRQIGWWLQLVDFRRETLECYELLKKATPAEAVVLMATISLKPFVLKATRAMVDAYATPSRPLIPG